MPYYGRGDYRGGYYGRGDPFSIRGFLSGVGAVGKSFLTGGVVGAVKTGIGLVSGAMKPGAPTPSLPPMIPTPNIPISSLGAVSGGPRVDVPRTTPGATPTPGFGGVVSRILPGGMSGYDIPLRGYHQIKKGPHAGNWTKNRRMNVVNPKALRRGLRRVQGFGKIVHRVKRAVARANSAVGNRHVVRRAVFGRRR